MRITILLIIFFVLHSIVGSGQNVTITPAGITPSTASTIPRLSYDAIKAISSPQPGDMAYDLTFRCLRVYNGQRWYSTDAATSTGTFIPDITALAKAGGSSSDYGIGIATDASGNVYIVGNFFGTATFGSTSVVSAGSMDIFVAKYNSSGVLQWVQRAGGDSGDYGYGVSTDASGSVYITGSFSGTAVFGGVSVTSAGPENSFVAKYNNSGTVQWVQSAVATTGSYGQAIATDASGNVFVSGYFSGTATFGSSSISSAGGSNDIFIAKYNSSGTVQWVRRAGGTSYDFGYGITTDVSGNVYVTGGFSGTASFGSSSVTSAGSADVFIARYSNSDGVLVWVRRGGGASNDLGLAVTTDLSGNVYVTGNFSGTASFGNSFTSEGLGDIFIAKYNSAGTVLWGRRAGGASDDSGFALATDASGNVYITGYFDDTATFGNSTVRGTEDIFVAKYNDSGAVLWVQRAGGASADYGRGIAMDASGNIYVTGYFIDTVTFGSNNVVSAGSSDIFVARLADD